MTDTERLERLERRMAEVDAILGKLVTVARAHPLGRQLVKLLGL